MIIRKVFEVLRVNHLCALILSFVIAYVLLSHIRYTLCPIWVLHSKLEHSENASDSSASVNYVASRMVHYGMDSFHDFSPSVLIIYGSNADGGSTLVPYKLPLMTDVEMFIINNEQKRSLHQISPYTRIHLRNETIVAAVVEHIQGVLICAVVAVPIGNDQQTATSYQVLLFNESWEMRWRQSVTISGQIHSSTVAVVHIASSCLGQAPGICGTVFTTFLCSVDHPEDRVVVALSAKDGAILWRSDSRAHVPDQKSFPDITDGGIGKHWKLAVVEQFRSLARTSEIPWKMYEDHLDNVLPIRWQNHEDSCFLALVHSSITKQAGQNLPDTLVLVHASGMDLFDARLGTMRSRLSTSWKPGATYALIPTVNQSGILFNTLGLTTLHEIYLRSELTRASDTQQSGTQIVSESGYENTGETDEDDSGQGDFSHTINCHGVLKRLDVDAEGIVQSGSRSSLILNGLCRPHSMFEFARFGRPEWLEDESKMVAPLVTKRHFPSTGLTGLWNSLFPTLVIRPRFHSTTQHEPNSHDLVFLTSDGSLTSVSNLGYENWHVNSEVSWLQVSRSIMSSDNSPVDLHMQQFYRDRFKPSLTRADIRPLGLVKSPFHRLLARLQSKQPTTFNGRLTKDDPMSIPVIVSIGWDSITVVDQYSGDLLASHKLPAHPVGKSFFLRLQLNDRERRAGLPATTSLIGVPCEGMLVVFGIQAQVQWLPTVCTVLALFASFILLSMLYAPDVEESPISSLTVDH